MAVQSLAVDDAMHVTPTLWLRRLFVDELPPAAGYVLTTGLLDCQLLPALLATPLDHITATLGSHAGTEAMNAFALALLWLPCALWHILSPVLC
jgi:hypothetical protein